MELKFLLAAFLGVILQEVLHWYDLRLKLHLKKYQQTLKSPSYWVITIIMIACSTGGVYFFLEANIDRYVARDFMVYGFAFPIIIKKAAAAVSQGPGEPTLGDEEGERKKGMFKEYLGI